MTYDPKTHHRHSIRLRGYDYSQPGDYFVTICTHQKEHLFGDVVEGEMKRNECGKEVDGFWKDLPRHYRGVDLDAYVVMPNHVHGIIRIVAPSGGRGGFRNPPLQPLSEIVRGFKTYSARRINEMRHTPGRPLWQRSYFEHIVRGPRELGIIREYIATNPLRWLTDPEDVLPL